MTKSRILTGIKPTGTPHLGNYFGTIKPALAQIADFDESFMFIANYHALNQIQDPKKLEELTLSITATWLACGLDPNKTHLYAQSDVNEVTELETVLNAFTPKGWMNKAHAYKAVVDKNSEAGHPADDGVSMGLYTYPVLMAADIILYDAQVVPVGKDQIQHVEIARDIAQRINSHYGQDLLVPPEYKIAEDVGTIIGTDGRKMSKSYDNIIPLFATPEERLSAVNRIVTDSSAPKDKKEVTGKPIYELYTLVASEGEASNFKSKLEDGQMGWGDAKQELAAKLNQTLDELTQEYNRLMDNPDEIKAILREGADKVRPIAQATMQRVRSAIGIV